MGGSEDFWVAEEGTVGERKAEEVGFVGKFNRTTAIHHLLLLLFTKIPINHPVFIKYFSAIGPYYLPTINT